MTGIARLGGGVRRVALGLILAASLGTAVGVLVGGPAFAAGETGGSPTEPTGTGTSNCPSSNPPNQLTLVAGTPQTAILQSAFATGLQVALSNSDGCPVTSAAAGIPVTFSAPASGASGVFSTSGSNTVIVGADASGSVAAPPFTANGTAGSYTVTASSQYGSVSFSLTNTAAGVPARIVAIPLKSRIGERHRSLPAAAAGQGPRRRRQPGRGHDGHVHARLRQRRHLRHEHRRRRELHRRRRPGHRHHRRERPRHLPGVHREQRRRLVHRHRLGRGRRRERERKAPAKAGRPPSRR